MKKYSLQADDPSSPYGWQGSMRMVEDEEFGDMVKLEDYLELLEKYEELKFVYEDLCNETTIRNK